MSEGSSEQPISLRDMNEAEHAEFMKSMNAFAANPDTALAALTPEERESYERAKRSIIDARNHPFEKITADDIIADTASNFAAAAQAYPEQLANEVLQQQESVADAMRLGQIAMMSDQTRYC